MNHHLLTGRLNRPVLFLACIFVLTVLTGCDDKPQWNVVIVTFDTTRADHLGAYGDENAMTPVVDQLARDGVLFERAAAPVPITLPSHSTIMTGKVPFTHGIRDNGLFILDEDQITLAEILSDAGYQTGAAIASFPVTSQFGIAQGFDFFEEHITTSYEDMYGQRSFPKSRLFFDERPASRVNEAIFPWLEANHDEPFMLWVHYFDPHHPHEPPAPYNQLFAHDLYAGEIAFTDESLGVLIDRLKQLGVYDNTIFVMTADHGEGNYEHNESTHSMLMYNSTMHVPLIIRHPEKIGAGMRIEPWVGTVDILPTLLDLLELPIPDDLQGSSLWPYVETPDAIAESVKNEVYAETLSPRLSHGWGELRGLYHGDIKYIHGPRPELYDLSDDHDELNNLIEQKPELAAEMKSRLQAYIDDHRIEGLDSSVSVSQETLDRLRGLGYVQFGDSSSIGPIEERLRSDGEPPQDHARTTSTYSQAKNLLFAGKTIEASRFIQSLLKDDPENASYLDLLVKSELARGRYAVAMDLLKRLPVDGNGPFSGAQLLRTMAQVHLAMGEPAEALTKYRDAQTIEATAEGHYRIAQLLAQSGDLEGHQQNLEQAIEIEPSFVPARVDLAVVLAQQGHTDQARAQFEQSLIDNPYDARSLYNFGAFLVQISELDLAVRYFQRALSLNEQYTRAHYALIETLYTLGKSSRARLEVDRLISYAPDTQEAVWALQLREQNP